MAPIRVALIGLSQSAKTSWAASAHLPYLLSERGRAKYRIVALLNSSEAAAKNAIQTFDLPSDVKAYGSPEDLAADANVDLVVCATRVDVHYGTVKPSVAAGRNVYVEWPLAENATRAAELAALARQSGSKTVIGLQGRVSPVVLKIKQLLHAQTIGKVVSSDVVAFTPGGGGDSIAEGLAYFFEKKVGGNPVTVQFGHMIDFIHTILGGFVSSHAYTQIQRPKQIVRKENGGYMPTISDVPDFVSLQGSLKPSEIVADGAVLVATFRSGPPFPGTVPFVWTITGQKGRIRVSSERGPAIGSAAGGFAIPIEVEDFSSSEVREESWEYEDWQKALPVPAKNIGKLYDLYAEGRLGEFGTADFDAAVARHKEIDQILY